MRAAWTHSPVALGAATSFPAAAGSASVPPPPTAGAGAGGGVGCDVVSICGRQLPAPASGVTSSRSTLRTLRSSPASVRIVSHAPLRAMISPNAPAESTTREPTPIAVPAAPGAGR